MRSQTAKDPSREALQIIQRMAKKAIFKRKEEPKASGDEEDEGDEKDVE